MVWPIHVFRTRSAIRASIRPRTPSSPTPLPTFRGAAVYGTFRLNFHHFDRFELDLRGHTRARGATFSCLPLKLADVVLIGRFYGHFSSPGVQTTVHAACVSTHAGRDVLLCAVAADPGMATSTFPLSFSPRLSQLRPTSHAQKEYSHMYIKCCALCPC